MICTLCPDYQPSGRHAVLFFKLKEIAEAALQASSVTSRRQWSSFLKPENVFLSKQTDASKCIAFFADLNDDIRVQWLDCDERPSPSFLGRLNRQRDKRTSIALLNL